MEHALSVVVAAWTMALPPSRASGSVASRGHSAHELWLTMIHALVGFAALGVLVVLRANGFMFRRLRFRNYRPIMRAAYALYAAAIILGLAARLMYAR